MRAVVWIGVLVALGVAASCISKCGIVKHKPNLHVTLKMEGPGLIRNAYVWMGGKASISGGLKGKGLFGHRFFNPPESEFADVVFTYENNPEKIIRVQLPKPPEGNTLNVEYIFTIIPLEHRVDCQLELIPALR